MRKVTSVPEFTVGASEVMLVLICAVEDRRSMYYRSLYLQLGANETNTCSYIYDTNNWG